MPDWFKEDIELSQASQSGRVLMPPARERVMLSKQHSPEAVPGLLAQWGIANAELVTDEVIPAEDDDDPSPLWIIALLLAAVPWWIMEMGRVAT